MRNATAKNEEQKDWKTISSSKARQFIHVERCASPAPPALWHAAKQEEVSRAGHFLLSSSTVNVRSIDINFKALVGVVVVGVFSFLQLKDTKPEER